MTVKKMRFLAIFYPLSLLQNKDSLAKKVPIFFAVFGVALILSAAIGSQMHFFFNYLQILFILIPVGGIFGIFFGYIASYILSILFKLFRSHFTSKEISLPLGLGLMAPSLILLFLTLLQLLFLGKAPLLNLVPIFSSALNAYIYMINSIIQLSVAFYALFLVIILLGQVAAIAFYKAAILSIFSLVISVYAALILLFVPLMLIFSYLYQTAN